MKKNITDTSRENKQVCTKGQESESLQMSQQQPSKINSDGALKILKENYLQSGILNPTKLSVMCQVGPYRHFYTHVLV